MGVRDFEPDSVGAQINDLYWDSDASVNDIAAEMDLSKGTLYGMIQPRSAGRACPECGTDLVYANRTARDKQVVSCPECGLEDETSLLVVAGDDAVPPPPSYAAERLPGGRVVLAAALLGAAAGLMLVHWVRKR